MSAPDHEQLDDAVVLVTAFGPFPGQEANPTEAIVDALAGEEHVVGHVLEVSYEKAPARVDALVEMVRPAAVLAFGVTGLARGIRLEEVARNRGGATTPDVDGSLGPGDVIDAGPETVPSRLPLAAIADALVGAGILVEPSDDAGTYVCNHLFRHLVTNPALDGLPVGFVHVPDPAGDGPLDLEDVVLAGRITVEVVAAHARGEV